MIQLDRGLVGNQNLVPTLAWAWMLRNLSQVSKEQGVNLEPPESKAEITDFDMEHGIF